MNRVTSLVGMELERAARTRTTWALSGTMLVVAVLVAYGAAHPAAAGAAAGGSGASAGHDLRAALGGVAALRVLVVLLGVLCVTSQYHHGDVVWRYLADPSRVLFVVGKALACAVIGALLGLAVLQIGVLLVVAHAGSAAAGVSFADVLRTVTGTILGMALAGVLGVGIGAAVRSQTAAVVGTLVAVLLVEPLIAAVAPAVGDFLPSAAASAAAGGTASLGWAVGLALYTGYAAVAVVVGTVLCASNDV